MSHNFIARGESVIVKEAVKTLSHLPLPIYSTLLFPGYRVLLPNPLSHTWKILLHFCMRHCQFRIHCIWELF